jgi:hypothetical protein
LEGGFSVFVPEAYWGELLGALEGGLAFEVAPHDGALPFAIVVEGGAPLMVCTPVMACLARTRE